MAFYNLSTSYFLWADMLLVYALCIVFQGIHQSLRFIYLINRTSPREKKSFVFLNDSFVVKNITAERSIWCLCVCLSSPYINWHSHHIVRVTYERLIISQSANQWATRSVSGIQYSQCSIQNEEELSLFRNGIDLSVVGSSCNEMKWNSPLSGSNSLKRMTDSLSKVMSVSEYTCDGYCVNSRRCLELGLPTLSNYNKGQ